MAIRKAKAVEAEVELVEETTRPRTRTLKSKKVEPAPVAKKPEVKEDKELLGIADFVEATGAQDTAIRNWLRTNQVEKHGKRYGWDQEEFDELVEKFNNRPARATKTEVEPEPEPEPAPAPKAKVRRRTAK